MADDTNTLIKGSTKLEDWKTRIRAGIRYRTIYGKSKEWTEYKNMYRGFWGKDVVPVNIVYAIGRAMIPQVYFKNPRISVYPMKPGYGMHARIWERIDNYLIKELWLKGELKTSILDCYLCGRGPGVLGYDSEYGFNPSFMSDEFSDESLTSFNRKGEKIEYQNNVKPGMPWFLRCNPTDFVVPWGTVRWEDAQWFAYRKMRQLKDIKEDPKYKNTSNLKAPYRDQMAGSSEQNTGQNKKMHEGDPDKDWVELWNIHDLRSGRLFVITLDHNKFLRDDVDYLQEEGLPSHVLGFNEDPDHFWWTPDVRLIRHQQQELNDIRTMAKKHRRVALLKVLADKGLDKDELAKLLDGDPKAVVRIDASQYGDIRKAVALFQSHVPPDLTRAAAEVREDVREIVGFSRNQMGAYEAPGGRRTAHEAAIVRAASMIRVDERRDIVADHLEKIIRSMNQLVARNWVTERVIDIVGPDGAKYWVRFTGKEIKGEFAHRINPEEQVPGDTNTRKQDAKEFMQIAANVPGVNMKYLMEQYSRQFDWLDPQMLMPGEGYGRSPEKAMMFNDFRRMGQGQRLASGNPALL
ncbi:hypothetical protein EU522_01470 [Candidatus Thorarchaeota archaeon]|nr:MAG: hypothetical protein EU522_01470 [Candidatus Thorarchaeota archaeon]